jgi:uncharacterized membrane protein (DUF106 family)
MYTVEPVGPTDTEKEEQLAVLGELNNILLYEITISVLAVVLSCIIIFVHGFVVVALSAVIITIVASFLLTLLMSLKRLKALLDLRFT